MLEAGHYLESPKGSEQNIAKTLESEAFRAYVAGGGYRVGDLHGRKNTGARVDGTLPRKGTTVVCDKPPMAYTCGCTGKQRVYGGMCAKEDCERCTEWAREFSDTGKSKGAWYGITHQRKFRRTWSSWQQWVDPATKAMRSPVVYLVCTVPDSLRWKFKDPVMWKHARRELLRALRDRFGYAWGMERTHPCGDSCKMHKRDPNWKGQTIQTCGNCQEVQRKFAPHLNLLFTRHEGMGGYLPPERLAELKAIWAGIIGHDGKVDIHWRYSTSLRKVRHWVRYIVRPFPGWRWWTGNLIWWGKGKPKMDRTPCQCKECGQGFKLLGYLTPAEVVAWDAAGNPTEWTPPERFS